MRELSDKEVVCETDYHNSKMNYHPMTKKMRNICSQDICTLFYLVKCKIKWKSEPRTLYESIILKIF